MKKFLTSLFLAVALAGCAATAIETPRQGVLACYYTVRAAFDTAADLKRRGQISPEQDKKFLRIADQATASCQAARAALVAGDQAQGNAQLKIAEALLLQLEAILKTQGTQP